MINYKEKLYGGKGRMKEKILKKVKNSKGITLIALVVTIVVLVIVAGSSIAMLAGDNGIIKKAVEAEENTRIEKIREQIKLAYQDSLIKGQGKLTEDALEKALKSEFNKNTLEEGWLDKTSIANKWKITIDGVSLEIQVGTDSKNTIDFEAIMEEAKANREGDEEIGIGTDGSIVDMSLWMYMKDDTDKTIELGDKFGSDSTSSYSGEFPNGKIVGPVPQYIMPEGEDEFYTVTGMANTFDGCTNLTTAPEIPSSVEYMGGTFYGCTSLTTAPEIPSSVTDMSSTFAKCTNLTTAPEIPSSVTAMSYTFSGCTSLTTAPEIPSSVTSLSFTFFGCTSLTTAPEIPSSVTAMSDTFGRCTSLTTAPEIPSSVTHMDGTFDGCTNLTGTVTINANPAEYRNCFYRTEKPIVLTGSSTKLQDLANTSTNGNVTVSQ